MTMQSADLSDAVRRLHQEFDQAFEHPWRPQAARGEPFLAVRLGGDPYALPLADVAGLHADRRLVPVPSPLPAFMGLTAFREQVAPVYDLAALLDLQGGPAPRWLILARSAEPVAFAFDVFETHFVVAADAPDAAPAQAGTSGSTLHRHLSSLVAGPDGLRPVIDLASVIEQLRRQVQAATDSQTRKQP
jgi:chemotaxis signal transduction protein